MLSPSPAVYLPRYDCTSLSTCPFASTARHVRTDILLSRRNTFVMRPNIKRVSAHHHTCVCYPHKPAKRATGTLYRPAGQYRTTHARNPQSHDTVNTSDATYVSPYQGIHAIPLNKGNQGYFYPLCCLPLRRFASRNTRRRRLLFSTWSYITCTATLSAHTR